MSNEYADEPLATDQTAWLLRAAQLRGKTPLQTALMILTQAVEYGRYGGIVLYPKTLEEHGLKRTAVYRALLELQRIGLVDVKRKYGKSPIIDIIDIVEAPAQRDPLVAKSFIGRTEEEFVSGSPVDALR